MGGKKKSTTKVIKKKPMKVPKDFKCIFCNHDASVKCKMDHRTMVGDLRCTVCGEHFQTSIHSLTDPIDVFSEWLDETQKKQLQA